MTCNGCNRQIEEINSRWCSRCRATAVETPAQAHPLVEQVVRWAEKFGISLDGIILRVNLSDRLEKAAHLGATHTRTLVRGRKRIRTRILGISVVKGLPALVFQGVVAHELGHVWTALRGIRFQPWAEEGFCEMLAHRYYFDLGTPEAIFQTRRIETNPEPLYGGGFRRMRRILGVEGLRRLIHGR
jgi:hypothetical protein